MRLIILAGSPACGKTLVTTHLIKHIQSNQYRPAVCKIDCITSEDEGTYAKLGIPVAQGLSGNICPDHYLATNVIPIFNWGLRRQADVLLLETAGLCNRCAPFTQSALNLCIVDAMGSIKGPAKLGPILTTADALIVTKVDLITQAEREVLCTHLQQLNPTAKLFEVNGISGFGSSRLARWLFENAGELDTLEGDTLKYDMPSANCAYCVGERRLGSAFSHGILEPITLED